MNSIFENFYIGDLLLDKELKEILSTKSSLNAVILFEKTSRSSRKIRHYTIKKLSIYQKKP